MQLTDAGRPQPTRRWAAVRWTAAATLATVSTVGGSRGGAEEILIRGMGRTVGWVVATEAGEVRFRDCQGLLHGPYDGRVEATSSRCPGATRPVEVVGAVTRMDPVLRVLVVEEAPGRRHAFYVDPGRPDAPALADLRPGQIVRVTGPTVGRATVIGPP